MKLRLWDGNLKIRLIGETLFNLLYWMYFPFITVYFSKSLGNHTAGMMMTVPPLISILGSMYGGTLTDRLGRRPIMLAGNSIRTVMFSLFAISSSPWLNYFAYLGIGLGGALYRPASDAMIADLIPEKERRQVFATFITANNIGAVLGPAIGAYFFFHYRSELLWTCAIFMLIYSNMIFFKIHETMPVTSKKPDQRNGLTASIKVQWLGYGNILRDKVFLFYILAGVFSVITIMQLDLYLAIYVTKNVPSQSLFAWGDWSFKLSGSEILGWMLGLNGLLFVLLVLPLTKGLKNWNDRDVFILSSIVAGAGMFAVGLTTNIWLLFISTVVFTVGEVIRSPIINNFVSDYAPDNARGQYMGAASLQFTIGRFLAPGTVFLSEWVKPIGVFTIILVSALISVVLYLKLYKIYPQRQK